MPAVPRAAGGTLDGFLADLFAPAVAVPVPHVRFVVALSLGFGLWTDVLFNGAGLGVNATLWFATLAALIVVAGRRLGRPLPRDRMALLAAAVALSAVTGWRDSDELQGFGIVAALGLFGGAAGLASGVGVRRMSPIAGVIALVACGAALCTSAWRLIARSSWRVSPGTRAGFHAGAVVRAVAIALPILLVFGALFAGADAVFEAQIDRFFNLDLSRLTDHAWWLLFGFWFGSAALSSAVVVQRGPEVVARVPERLRLGRVETGIILGSLAALFALFVGVQVRYLFGGEDAVRSSVALTYAEYARRGFFELVAASLLLLPVLAAIDWARQRTAPARRQFLLLGAALLVLLLVIMASAAQRLAMYVEAFGLTELRVYAAATLPWLGAALVWFLVSVVRDRIEEFMAGAIALVVVVLLALFAASPDDLTVRVNTARLAEGKPFDAAYAATLSADAVPRLVAEIAALPAEQRCELAPALRSREHSGDGVRSWNLSRARAAAALRGHSAELCPSAPAGRP